jgi:endonuclease G
MPLKRTLFIYLLIFTVWTLSCTKESVGNTTFPENGNMAFGNPDNATSDTQNASHYLIKRSQYYVSYNNNNHIANWVSWHLTASDLGTTKRQNSFKPDTSLPTQWYKSKASDYSLSGFDRGHLCPSADRTACDTDNYATFLLTNIIPQAPKVNRVGWEHLEAYCRELIADGNELYIIAGVHGTGGEGEKGYASSIKHDIVVPSNIWKIIIVLPLGNNDLKRVTGKTRVIAIYMPNTQEAGDVSWIHWRTSVDAIETATGYDFLSILPDNIEKVIEAKTDTNEL